MNNIDYPELFQVSDYASGKAQGAYTRAVLLQLLFVTLAAFAGALALGGVAARISAISAAIFLLVSVIVSYIIRMKQWERKWFDTRAIAESVKTLTWRYMMGASPFSDKAAQDADKDFVKYLKSIKGALPNVIIYLTTFPVKGGGEITDEMSRIRDLSVEERKRIYLEGRVINQRNWYKAKSQYNGRCNNDWFWTVFGIQITAILIAIGIAVQPGWPYNPVGPLTTVIVSIVAWTYLKRHHELLESYAMAAHELAEIEDIAADVIDKDGLAEFVVNAEGAMSREHTMWYARRNISLVGH